MAGDTFTEFLNLTKPEIGGSRDSWGQKINSAFDAIDTWAKATDTLAKNALSKEVATAQTVKGATTFAAAATFSTGASMPKGYGWATGTAAFQELADGSSTDIKVGAANRFRLVNNNYTAQLMVVSPTEFTYKDATVWYSGNFTPANYFDRTTNTAQQVNNLPSFNAKAIDIVSGGVMRWRIGPQSDSYFRLNNGDNGANYHAFGTGGDIWTSQMGDVNGRIEDRAAAFANDRLATARAEYANHAKLSGAGFTGDVWGPHFTATGGDGYVALDSRDGARGALFYNAGNLLRIFDRTGGDRVRFNLIDGSIWTNQFGDVHNRIEDRASAWANDRLAVARNEYGLKYDKTGGTLSGDVTIGSKTYPVVHLYWHNVIRAGWMLDTDASVMWRNSDSGDVMHRLYTNGAIWTKQFGDLNQRIEDRAYAYRNDAIAVCRNEYSGHVKYYNYNEFTADQRIGKAWPELQLLWGGVARWGIRVNEDAKLYFRRPDDNYLCAAMGYNGDFYVGQFGDLNSRIEARAAAWATDQANDARTRADRITGRLAYAGDLDNNWNLGQSYAEPYQGGVLTSRYTTSYASATYWSGGRWRFMQMKGTNDAWYTISYV